MEIENKVVMVTGGAGFIGSNLVDELSKKSKVIVVDNFSSGKLENLASHKNSTNIKIIKEDVLNKNNILQLMKGVEIVFHLAAKCQRLSFFKPHLVHKVNTAGTLNLLISSLKNEVKRFIYISSSEIYGTAKAIPMKESHPCEPTTVYGVSKLVGELYAKAFFKVYNLPVIIIRPFNTYGKRSHFEGVHGEVIPKFIIRALNNLPLIIYGNGKQTRDFIYIDDTIRGILSAAECDNLIGDVINVGTAKEVSINEIAKIVLTVLKKDIIEVSYLDNRPGDIERHCADISKAKRLLNFVPKVQIKEGIKMYINWLMAQDIDFEKALKKEKTLCFKNENFIN